VTAQVGSLAGIQSDETAPITMAAAGTNGQVETAAIAGVHLAPLATVGAVTDSIDGTNTASAFNGSASSRIGAVNLLNGAIRADVIGSAAAVTGSAPGFNPTLVGSATLVNLVIGGKPIDLNTAPNTQIKLGNIAQITINQQIHPTSRSLLVRALDIKLLVATDGFPAGAEIEVAVSRVAVA